MHLSSDVIKILQGKTLLDVLDEIYSKYGRYNDLLYSVTMKGEDGGKKIAQIMERLRSQTVSEIAGLTVAKVTDFKNDATGLPVTDLMIYSFEDGGFVAVRPSGTEPKCKFYYCIKDADVDTLRNYFENV